MCEVLESKACKFDTYIDCEAIEEFGTEIHKK